MKRVVTVLSTRDANRTRPSRTLFLALRLPLASRKANTFVKPVRRQFSKTTLGAQQAVLSLGAKSEIDNGEDAPSSDAGKGEEASAPPPEGDLSIVFTDIVKSTAIWEAHTPAMTEAMQLHDSIIRKATMAYHGYEVKQNGDGFMLAFSNATSAIQFCLSVQHKLLSTDWPPALLELRPGEERTDEGGKVLFRGLRLRMSAHWGRPVCNWNEVIERMDYLGPMVNRAARFIEVTEGGQIVVSEEFLGELQNATGKAEKGSRKTGEPDIAPNRGADGAGQDSVSRKASQSREVADLKGLQCAEEDQQMLPDSQFEVRPLGKHEFKGLTERQMLYFIIPYSLRGRLEHWPKHYRVQGSKGNLTYGQG